MEAHIFRGVCLLLVTLAIVMAIVLIIGFARIT